jgi:hypothetical protein
MRRKLERPVVCIRPQPRIGSRHPVFVAEFPGLGGIAEAINTFGDPVLVEGKTSASAGVMAE